MSEKAERPREFVPVDSQKEALSLIREGAKTLATAMIWTKNQEQVINTHLSLYSDTDQVLYVWCPKEVEPNKLANDLERSGSQDCYFSVSLARANLFFRVRKQLLNIPFAFIPAL